MKPVTSVFSFYIIPLRYRLTPQPQLIFTNPRDSVVSLETPLALRERGGGEGSSSVTKLCNAR
jgi:hypothetical protein